MAHYKQLNKLTIKNEQLKTETEKLKEVNDLGFKNIEQIDMEKLSAKKAKDLKQEK